LPAARVAAVLTLQVLHDYSDREAAEAAPFDVRWKVAIGAPLDDPGFDPSSLVYWRNRIARSRRPDRISDVVKKVVRETGILRVWVPITLSPHATWAYSWIKPPSRSRRSTRIFVPAAGGCERPAGGFCCSAQRRLTRSACQRSRVRGEMIRRSRQPSPSF